MVIRAAEISKVLNDQIANFGTDAQVSEVGTLLSVLSPSSLPTHNPLSLPDLVPISTR